MPESVQNDVPQHRLGEVVQSYADDGKTHIVCTKNASGTWTVRAS